MTTPQNKILTQIYVRLNYMLNGNLNSAAALLEYPSKIKPLKNYGLIKELPEQYTKKRWYSLTERGKIYFSQFIEKIDKETYWDYIDGRKIKEFPKPDVVL